MFYNINVANNNKNSAKIKKNRVVYNIVDKK